MFASASGGSMKRTWGVVIAMTGFAAVAHGCSKGLSSCPPGLIRQGETCVPVPDTTPHEVVFRDDDLGHDTLPNGSDKGYLDGADLSLDEPGASRDTAPGGFIGLSCSKDSDCRKSGANGVCLDWPGGYCTLLDCGGEGGECPDGAVCLGITPNKPACAQACSGSADCRGGDIYGCKALLAPDGALVRVCYQVKNKGGPGEGCGGHQDCAGDASCLTAFAGGYCAVLGCGPDRPCPDGTACVVINNMPACLKRCAGSEDCVVPGDLPRTCASLRSALVPGEKIKVCASGTLGVPIGGQCLSDMECASEDCEVVVTGKCSASGAGCRQDNDCPTFAEVCIQSAADTRGFCTKACGLSAPCPAQSFCVGTKVGGSGQAEGFCLPACLQPGDLTCRAEVGLSCVYGDPINASGRYTCARIPKGSPGTGCSTASDCLSAACLMAQGGGGYCVSSCGYFEFCPFPTSCQEVGGHRRCLLRCLSVQDCPPGHECGRPVGALLDVCYPK